MVSCVAVFDIGKTNKKFLLFNQQNEIIKEEGICIEETTDEDGDPCEDLAALTQWVTATWQRTEADLNYDVKGVNFTTYGASLVHLDKLGLPVTPLYNYLKPYPPVLEEQFYLKYGDRLTIGTHTSSPALGMLNAGLQLYWLKHQKPEKFTQITHTLHFPQYIAYLFTGQLSTEYTSIGCHTALWNFRKNDYHSWVYQEELDLLFPPLRSHQKSFKIPFRNKFIQAGLGLHNSSSALIPYLKEHQEPFLFLSTGAWGITLNPFAQEPLTLAELQRDCLQCLTLEGKPVKTTRKFIGNTHEEQVKVLATHYQKRPDFYKLVAYDKSLVQDHRYLKEVNTQKQKRVLVQDKVKNIIRLDMDLTLFDTYEAAYHQLLVKLVRSQAKSIYLAAEGSVQNFKTLLVEGGFSQNEIFMSLLQEAFPTLEVKVAQTAQSTALGAAMLLEVLRKPEPLKQSF